MNAENRAADKAALSYSLADGLTFTIFWLRMLFCNEKQHLNEMLSKLLMPLQYTPTHVGKVSIFGVIPSHQEHSHLRGKKETFPFLSIVYSGLLPLAWEKCYIYCFCRNSSRYTPTCVGKSS